MIFNSSRNLIVWVSLFCIVLALQNQPVFSEENKPVDIYSTPEYKAASEKFNTAIDEFKQIKDKAFIEDPALKKAYGILAEGLKYGAKEPTEWLNSAADKKKAKKDLNNLKRYWSEYNDYQGAVELSKEAGTKKLLAEFVRVIFKGYLAKKEELKKRDNKQNQLIIAALNSITDIDDDEQVLSAYLKMMKSPSEAAKEKYDRLLEECGCPEDMLEAMKDKVRYFKRKSLARYYKTQFTPSEWLEANDSFMKVAKEFADQYPGGVKYEANKRRKALSKAAEKQKAETDVF